MPLQALRPDAQPLRLHGGERFASELQRTEEVLQGRSRTHQPIPRGDGKRQGASQRPEERAYSSEERRASDGRETRDARGPRREPATQAPSEARPAICAESGPARGAVQAPSAATDEGALTAPSTEETAEPAAAASAPADAPAAHASAATPPTEFLPRELAQRAPAASEAGAAGRRALAADGSERQPLPAAPIASARSAVKATRAGSAEAARAQAEERAERVLAQVRQQLVPPLRNALIQLEPADLGRIAIRLSLNGPQLGGSMRVESRETYELLERHLPELRAALSGMGLDAQGFQLELGLGGDAQDSPQPSDARRSASSARPISAPDTNTAVPATVGNDSRSAIDTYA